MTNPPDPLAKFLGEMKSAKDGICYDGPEWSTVYKNGYNDAFDSQQKKIDRLIKICRIQAEALDKISKSQYADHCCQTVAACVDLADCAFYECNQIVAEGVDGI